MAIKPLRFRALDRALGEVGVKEDPPGSNWGPRVSQYIRSTGYNFPLKWCLAFVHWCYQREGFVLPGRALVQAFDNWATHAGAIVERPLKGDIVCYDWDGDHWDDHVGIIIKVLALRWRNKKFVGWIKTVEGNTSYGNNSNGGQVQIRYRWANNCQFARVRDAGDL